jgi:hypothetical protein
VTTEVISAIDTAGDPAIEEEDEEDQQATTTTEGQKDGNTDKPGQCT